MTWEQSVIRLMMPGSSEGRQGWRVMGCQQTAEQRKLRADGRVLERRGSGVGTCVCRSVHHPQLLAVRAPQLSLRYHLSSILSPFGTDIILSPPQQGPLLRLGQPEPLIFLARVGHSWSNWTSDDRDAENRGRTFLLGSP